VSITGTKPGSLVINVNIGGAAGLGASQSLAFSGSAAPPYGLVAAAALAGTITAGTVTLSAAATFAGTEKVALYWTVAGVNYYRYDCTIAGGTGTTFAITGGSGTALPTSGQAILLATNQDLTLAAQGVSILGDNLQQLLATSTQPGLVEWLSAAPAQQRLSFLPAGGSFDTWPTAAGQAAPPSGGAGANWTAATTVTTLRFWNFSTTTATMQVSALLA